MDLTPETSLLIEIKKSLKPYLLKGISSISLTDKFKHVISEIGIKEGYEIFTSGSNRDSHEWLFDIAWCKSNQNGFQSLELAAESELIRSLDAIKLDFDKLLVTNARIKIMFCLSLSLKKGFDIIVDQCTRSLNNYDLLPKGTTINLLIWDDFDSDDLIHKQIIKF